MNPRILSKIFLASTSLATLPAAGPTGADPHGPAHRPVLAQVQPALPGRAGVVAWVEGSRRGGSLRQVVAAEATGGMRTGFERVWTHREVSETAANPLPSGSVGRAPAKGWGSELPAGRRASLARAGTAPPLSFDILLLIQRQNE